MQLFGPPPEKELLRAAGAPIRTRRCAAVADALGLCGDGELQSRLVEMLGDPFSRVRRRTCEALLRTGQPLSFESLVPLLTSDDRFEAWAARRLLERLPAESWRDKVLATPDHRLFIQGGLALLTANGDQENARAVLQRFITLMDEMISDRDFTDMLRLAEIALIRGSFNGRDVPALCGKLAEEFPSSNDPMNREIVRLLAYLQVTSPMDRYLDFLTSPASDSEKLHLALHLRYLTEGWQEGQRMRVIDFYEWARKQPGRHQLCRLHRAGRARVCQRTLAE